MKISIRQATVEDAAYVVSLQRRFSNALGFLPAIAIEEFLRNRHVLLALENGDPSAYLLFRPSTRHDPLAVNIVQAAVQLDAQRRHVGLALLDRLTRTATAAHKRSLQCKCAADLDSNSFWRAAGFSAVATAPSMGARGRTLISYKTLISR